MTAGVWAMRAYHDPARPWRALRTRRLTISLLSPCCHARLIKNVEKAIARQAPRLGPRTPYLHFSCEVCDAHCPPTPGIAVQTLSYSPWAEDDPRRDGVVQEVAAWWEQCTQLDPFAAHLTAADLLSRWEEELLSASEELATERFERTISLSWSAS